MEKFTQQVCGIYKQNIHRLQSKGVAGIILPKRMVKVTKWRRDTNSHVNPKKRDQF